MTRSAETNWRVLLDLLQEERAILRDLFGLGEENRA